jgi:DNA-binding CsgD family transcriptional regulator/N-acetylneuraminic acid mutarotase
MMLDTERTELSERELEILRLVATGASNKEVAQKLYISANTVKVHLRNIFAKIGAASRTEAALYAIRMGIIEQDTAGLTEEKEPVHNLGVSNEEGQLFEKSPFTLSNRVNYVLGIAITLILVLSVIILWRTNGLNAINEPISNPTFIAPVPEPRWRNLADIPTPRRNFATAVYENHMYAIAGESEDGIVGLAERYSLDMDSWDNVSPKPVPVTEVAASVIGGLIYVPGGRLPSGTISNVLEVYDPRQDIWEKRAALPLSVSTYASIAYEGHIFIFGGWDGEKYSNRVFKYDPGQDSWDELSAMPTARGFAGATMVDGKIYVIGGHNGDKALNVIEIYIPDRDIEGDNPWLIGEPMPEERYGIGAASVAGLIQVVGGVGNGQEINKILAYKPQTDSWEVFDESPETNWTQFGLITRGPYWYILGGEIDGTLSNRNISYQALFTISLPILR